MALELKFLTYDVWLLLFISVLALKSVLATLTFTGLESGRLVQQQILQFYIPIHLITLSISDCRCFVWLLWAFALLIIVVPR